MHLKNKIQLNGKCCNHMCNQRFQWYTLRTFIITSSKYLFPSISFQVLKKFQTKFGIIIIIIIILILIK